MDKKIKTDLGNRVVFARNLERHIKKSGKSQRTIANEIGVCPSTISDWLNGRGYPRMDKLQKLSEYFGVSKSELVEDNYEVKESISGKEQKLLDLFHTVPEERRDGLLDLIEVYAKNLR